MRGGEEKKKRKMRNVEKVVLFGCIYIIFLLVFEDIFSVFFGFYFCEELKL